MNNLDIINDEIIKLEAQPMTYAIADKLASLYIIQEHHSPTAKKEVSPILEGSEFLETASSVDISSLLRILDEHMNVIQLLYPKEYEALIKKIKQLK